MELVQIDSVSFNEKDVASYLKKHFSDLGYEVVEDLKSKKAVPQSNTGNILVRVPGQGAMKDNDIIIMSAHMDTVEPGNGVKPSITEDGKYVVSDGTTILGADDKAGIAQIIELEAVLRETGVDHAPMEFLFTIAEEVGLLGAFNIDTDLVKGKIAFALDGGGGPGFAIVGGPDYHDITGTITGRAAHAGVAPEQGISSIQVMAEAITNMKLLKVDEDTSSNIGRVICDYPTNVVAEVTRFEMEVRSLVPEKAIKQVKAIKTALEEACDKYGAKLDFNVSQSLHAYHHEDSNPVIKLYKSMCERHNINYVGEVVRGGTDVSGFTYNGIDAICISAGGEFAHELRERLIIDEFISDIEQIYWLVTE